MKSSHRQRNFFPVPHSMAILLLLVAMSSVLAGCRTFQVQSDWDPEIPFERLHRYQWFEPPVREDASPFEDNTLLRKRVRVAIEAALAERGFLSVEDPGKADFLVTFGVVMDDRLRVDGANTGFGGFGGFGGYGGYGRGRRGGFGYYGTGINTTSVREYQESTLLIDFLSPEGEALIWRGWGTGIVQTRDRDRGQALLDQGVRKILAEFPPPYAD